LEFLKRAFNKLALNFTWPVNRKDIGVFEHSATLPTGRTLNRRMVVWMALYSQNMAGSSPHTIQTTKNP
jgi:hypothetical protein